MRERIREFIREYCALIVPCFLVLALIVMGTIALTMWLTGSFSPAEAQEPTEVLPFSIWRREGLRADVDQLRADLDQLRADHEALKTQNSDLALMVETLRRAAAFSMDYQVKRHQTLRDADFAVGHILTDIAGNRHPLTQDEKDKLTASTAQAEAHFTALTTP